MIIKARLTLFWKSNCKGLLRTKYQVITCQGYFISETWVFSLILLLILSFFYLYFWISHQVDFKAHMQVIFLCITMAVGPILCLSVKQAYLALQTGLLNNQLLFRLLHFLKLLKWESWICSTWTHLIFSAKEGMQIRELLALVVLNQESSSPLGLYD